MSASAFTLFIVYAPGSSTPSRTISEKIVPANQQASFTPNYMAVGPDGTLYVTEYSHFINDPLAGLYIYSPSGAETFVATTSNSQGAGPQGVDVDAVGNIYVANNNSGDDSNYTWYDDTLHDIEVFAPGGTSVLRHISDSTFSPNTLVTAPDGTIFFSSTLRSDNDTDISYAVFTVAAGASTETQVSSTFSPEFVLYNGYQESSALRHRETSRSEAASFTSGNSSAFRRYINRRRAMIH